jgi:hypothetical protein
MMTKRDLFVPLHCHSRPRDHDGSSRGDTKPDVAGGVEKYPPDEAIMSSSPPHAGFRSERYRHEERHSRPPTSDQPPMIKASKTPRSVIVERMLSSSLISQASIRDDVSDLSVPSFYQRETVTKDKHPTSPNSSRVATAIQRHGIPTTKTTEDRLSINQHKGATWRQSQISSPQRHVNAECFVHPQPQCDDDDGCHKRYIIHPPTKERTAVSSMTVVVDEHGSDTMIELIDSVSYRPFRVTSHCDDLATIEGGSTSVDAKSFPSSSQWSSITSIPEAINRIPLAILLMDLDHIAYEIVQAWIDPRRDTGQDILLSLQSALSEHPTWPDYDGLFSVSINSTTERFPKFRLNELIHVVDVAKYNARPFELWVAKPSSASTAITNDFASALLSQLIASGIVDHCHTDDQMMHVDVPASAPLSATPPGRCSIGKARRSPSRADFIVKETEASVMDDNISDIKVLCISHEARARIRFAGQSYSRIFNSVKIGANSDWNQQQQQQQHLLQFLSFDPPFPEINPVRVDILAHQCHSGEKIDENGDDDLSLAASLPLEPRRLNLALNDNDMDAIQGTEADSTYSDDGVSRLSGPYLSLGGEATSEHSEGTDAPNALTAILRLQGISPISKILVSNDSILRLPEQCRVESKAELATLTRTLFVASDFVDILSAQNEPLIQDDQMQGSKLVRSTRDTPPIYDGLQCSGLSNGLMRQSVTSNNFFLETETEAPNSFVELETKLDVSDKSGTCEFDENVEVIVSSLDHLTAKWTRNHVDCVNQLMTEEDSIIRPYRSRFPFHFRLPCDVNQLRWSGKPQHTSSNKADASRWFMLLRFPTPTFGCGCTRDDAVDLRASTNIIGTSSDESTVLDPVGRRQLDCLKRRTPRRAHITTISRLRNIKLRSLYARRGDRTYKRDDSTASNTNDARTLLLLDAASESVGADYPWELIGPVADDNSVKSPANANLSIISESAPLLFGQPMDSNWVMYCDEHVKLYNRK